MTEQTPLEKTLFTLNMVCAAFILIWAGRDLYFVLFEMGWSDVPIANTYYFNFERIHPAVKTVVGLRSAAGFVLAFSLMAAATALKHGHPWADRAYVFTALLTLVLFSANLAYMILVQNPAAQQALLVTGARLPAHFSPDVVAVVYSLPFLLYGIAILVIMRLRWQ